MKQHFLTLLMSLMVTTPVLANSNINEQSSERQQIGYSFGYLMGKSNINTVDDLDLNSFMIGFSQGFKGKNSVLSNEQMIQVLSQYKKKVEADELLQFQAIAAENLKAGNLFLANNAKKSDIKTTKSGLQYQILQLGNGRTPSTGNAIEVHYEGRLLDGTVFDSSIARDESVTLPLNKVIKGWQEAVQLMPEGSKYRLFIPAKLGYGELGSGDAIPPNSTLIFDIELIKIKS